MTLDKKKKFIINVAFIFTIYAVLRFIFVYAIHWFMPFIVGFLITIALRPVTRLVNKFIRRGKGAAIFAIAAFYAVIALLLWFLITSLISQITDLINIMPNLYFDRIEPLFLEFNEWIVENAKTVSPETANSISQIITNSINYISDIVKNASISIVQFITRLISNFPMYLITIIFTIVLSVFISVEYDNLTAFIKRQLPPKFNSTFSEARVFLTSTLWKMIKSYLIIMCITFLELFTGLSILRVDYALPIAAIVAVLDILPILGSGVILIPWAVVELILKNYSLCVGLFALYLVITIVRNIIEPRIVGSQIGLHPIITISSMYAGLKLFGFAGFILGPVAAILVKYLNDTGKIHLFK
jgi:sporulation integral membrane protein YtvI